MPAQRQAPAVRLGVLQSSGRCAAIDSSIGKASAAGVYKGRRASKTWPEYAK